MAKTTTQLDPAQALSLKNLITKNDKQLSAIYDAYSDQFSGSHITSKNEFVSFIRNYKIWREQMLRALPVIVARLQAESSRYPDFKKEIEDRMEAANIAKYDGGIILLLERYALDMVTSIETNDIEINYDAYSREMNRGLELFIKLFGTGEQTKTAKGKTATGAGSSGRTGKDERRI